MRICQVPVWHRELHLAGCLSNLALLARHQYPGVCVLRATPNEQVSKSMEGALHYRCNDAVRPISRPSICIPKLRYSAVRQVQLSLLLVWARLRSNRSSRVPPWYLAALRNSIDRPLPLPFLSILSFSILSPILKTSIYMVPAL